MFLFGSISFHGNSSLVLEWDGERLTIPESVEGKICTQYLTGKRPWFPVKLRKKNQVQPPRQHILLQLIVAVENGSLAEAAPKKQVPDMDVAVLEGIKQSIPSSMGRMGLFFIFF